VTTESVALESILQCLQGVVPSSLATSSADGIPNVTYVSIVQYVDPERVAISRQFLRKTAQNLAENRVGQAVVIDPETLEQYALDVTFLHTETDGPVFETMKANLEVIASHTGATDLFRLRGVDVHRVDRCVRLGAEDVVGPARDAGRDVLKALDDVTRRIAGATDLYDATRLALEALEDVLGFEHAILLTAENGADRLVGVASNGYPGSSAGAEVELGDGIIGVAARRRQVISIANMARVRAMGTAVQESARRRGDARVAREIPLPGLESAQSAAAVPLVLRGELLGVLYLESEVPGSFGTHNERLLRVIGTHLATVLAAFERDREEVGQGAPQPEPVGPAPGAEALEITYYQADDSVFAGGEYVIKGVPGRILWKLLREHAGDGRTTFTNRELRLDEGLGLPAGNDNLESRLVVLRRRLEAGSWGIKLERVARGRLHLHVSAAVALVEVPTQGPMRAAHGAG
jgi:predicted pyridoxine 5'-phosphate oxidase superfamily flavin-nucleotide-binding protein